MNSGATSALWRPYVGTVGVFLGAGIVSLGQRVLSVGLPDLRGALGLGFDEAAWIPTASGMALMFMGPFSVYLGALFGPRRVLLAAAPIFAITALLLPYAPNLSCLLALQVVAGLASGTFYPLSLSFALSNLPPRHTIYGIGVYSLELLATLSLGTPVQAWFAEHASWRWIFWHSLLLVPLMMLCIYLAIPPKPKAAAAPGAAKPLPKVSWSGFLFASAGLSLTEGALEQGERLDWFRSGTIVSMFAASAFLLAVATLTRWHKPNSLVNLRFLANRHMLLLGSALFSLRFVLLAIVVLVPSYLGTVQNYRPLETGNVLAWLCIPAIVAAFLAARAMRRLDGRIVASSGFIVVSIAALMNTQLTSVWASDDFLWPQIIIACGLAFTFVGVIGLIAQRALASGAIQRPVDILTFAGFFQVVRMLGGQTGTSLMQHLIAVREKFHSNVIGLNVQIGDTLTDEHLRLVAGGLYSGSSGSDESQARAVATLAGQVSRQAYTLAYADGFFAVAWICAAALVGIACMSATKIYFDGVVPSAPKAG